MAPPKRVILILAIYVFHGIIAYAQNVNIYLCPLSQADLVKSMVCVSSKSGESLFEYVLNENDIDNGSEYHITIPDPEHYCFTIINEYHIDTINHGAPLHWIKTYYDQGGDLHILEFDHPVIPSFYKDIDGSLTIKNAPVIEHWQHFTKATISNFNQTGDHIRTQTNFWPDEDLFVVLKAEKDKTYRYIYVPLDEIPITNNVVSPFNALQFDWKLLPTDLKHYPVYLPFETPFMGEISATNSSTGKTCFLFRSNSFLQSVIPSKIGLQSAPTLTSAKGILDLCIPNVPLDNYKARLTWGNWHNGISYEYRIWHGNEMKFPFYNEDLFMPEYLKFDSLGIQTKMNSYPKYFRIFFVKRDLDGLPKVGDNFHQSMQSNWIVIGQNKDDIDFEFPAISETSKEQFSALGKWRYEHFENVIFLEKDPNIDWINFFHDYNVLLVGYRNPIK